MMKLNKKKKITRHIIDAFLIVLSIIWILPVVFVVYSSFKSRQEYNLGYFWDVPKGNELINNLKHILDNSDIIQAMCSTLAYALIGATIAITLALLAAYAISHLNIKHRMFWFLFIYSGTIFPFQLYLIPIYKGYTTVGLYDTRLGMILVYIAVCIPFAMFVLRNFFIGIDKEIIESARIDGATDLQILIKIFMPMAKASLSICFLSQFLWAWNDLMFGITFTKSAEVRTVMSAISQMGTAHVPALLLACLIVSLPTTIMFLCLQDSFQQGFVYQSK